MQEALARMKEEEERAKREEEERERRLAELEVQRLEQVSWGIGLCKLFIYTVLILI